jgi:hypothetical protein
MPCSLLQKVDRARRRPGVAKQQDSPFAVKSGHHAASNTDEAHTGDLNRTLFHGTLEALGLGQPSL